LPTYPKEGAVAVEIFSNIKRNLVKTSALNLRILQIYVPLRFLPERECVPVILLKISTATAPLSIYFILG
jgi:hypothetical protein